MYFKWDCVISDLYQRSILGHVIRFNYQTELKFLTYSIFAVDKKLFRNNYSNTDDLLLDLDVAGFINLHLVRSLMTSSAREPIYWGF